MGVDIENYLREIPHLIPYIHTINELVLYSEMDIILNVEEMTRYDSSNVQFTLMVVS